MTAGESAQPLAVIAGRFVLGEVIGRGGAATVHLGKPVGEGRRGVVAIKRLHPHLAADPAFLAMMLDEARLLSRVRHANVVSTLDVVLNGGELYIAMEYVHGVTLGLLLGRAHAKRKPAPIAVACAVARDALLGLHAAHEATGPSGEPLGMVHRDVSPQNLLVAESGVLKVVDFGIAKAEGRLQHTIDGSIKGKLGYMAPEQLFGETLDRRADVYAAGVVLWETLVGERLFAGEDGGPALVKSLVSHVDAPSDRVPGIDKALDRVVLRALAHRREDRFESAEAMAGALCEAQPPASASDVAAWVRSLAADVLDERGARLFHFDSASRALIEELPHPRESLVSQEETAAAKRQRRTWALAAAAALCAAAGGGAAAFLGRPSVEPAGKDAAALNGSAAAPSATAAPAASDEGESKQEKPTVSPGDSPQNETTPGTASAQAASSAAASSRPSAPSTTAATPSPQATARATAARPAAKAGACDPPFTIDAQGHKRYKRECLR